MHIFLIILGVVLILIGGYGCIRDALVREDIKTLKSDRGYLEFEVSRYKKLLSKESNAKH